MKKFYKKICAHLFFIFFTCIIFSPYLKGKTIYLYGIIPFFDFFYLKWVGREKINRRLLTAWVGLIIILILYGDFEFIVRIFFIISTLYYLFYLKSIKLFSIFYNYIFLNIFIGILQFIFMYINPKIAYFLGPKNLSKTFLGSFAGPANTNFYSIGLLKRASGLSREVGFFASLMVITIILYIEDKDAKKDKWKSILLIIGFIISMSKMSFLLFVYFAIKKMKKYLNKIPMIITISIVIVFLIVFSKYLFQKDFFIPKHDTWNHRLGGYFIILKYNLHQLIFPLKTINEILNDYPKLLFLNQLSRLKTFTSISEIILHHGIIIFFSGTLLLKKLKLKTSDFLLLTLLTFNTGYITVTSYVILIYFYIFYEKRKESE